MIHGGDLPRRVLHFAARKVNLRIPEQEQLRVLDS